MKRIMVFMVVVAFILASSLASAQQKESGQAQEHEKHHPAQQTPQSQ